MSKKQLETGIFCKKVIQSFGQFFVGSHNRQNGQSVLGEKTSQPAPLSRKISQFPPARCVYQVRASGTDWQAVQSHNFGKRDRLASGAGGAGQASPASRQSEATATNSSRPLLSAVKPVGLGADWRDSEVRVCFSAGLCAS